MARFSPCLETFDEQLGQALTDCTSSGAFRGDWEPFSGHIAAGEARWSYLKANAKQPAIGQLVDEAMMTIERDNPTLREIAAVGVANTATGGYWRDVLSHCGELAYTWRVLLSSLLRERPREGV